MTFITAVTHADFVLLTADTLVTFEEFDGREIFVPGGGGKATHLTNGVLMGLTGDLPAMAAVADHLRAVLDPDDDVNACAMETQRFGSRLLEVVDEMAAADPLTILPHDGRQVRVGVVLAGFTADGAPGLRLVDNGDWLVMIGDPIPLFATCPNPDIPEDVYTRFAAEAASQPMTPAFAFAEAMAFQRHLYKTYGPETVSRDARAVFLFREPNSRLHFLELEIDDCTDTALVDQVAAELAEKLAEWIASDPGHVPGPLSDTDTEATE